MIKNAIKKVVSGQHLSEEEAGAVMEQIMEGGASPAQIASLLTAMRLKGETVDEITGFARVMRQKSTRVKSKHPVLVDTCGTGGDGAGTFNISTAAAFVVAGAGVPVAKHGNRSVSSRCGSADVLEELGVRVDLDREAVEECLNMVGMAFLFAPLLHRSMGYVAGPRREIGIRTVFNILGPLTNPAGANAQVLGVYSPFLAEMLAKVLARLGVSRAFVVHGAGGLDEISLAGPSILCEVRNGSVRRGLLDPARFGFRYAPVSVLAGGTPRENAAIALKILEGERGARRDVVVLNAALGLVAGGKARNIAEGLEIAALSIDSGLAVAKLRELVEFTGNLSCGEAAVR
ncbi:MAG: anthranilate phosphoribosyltransferase [Pelotomaculum sp.]|uniref:Anthranilate phosphoribosyltransferase n=1 Tax=Pelotomaculum thermopropionicum (strain DSM 13744 / JCM 10971 / SI) TaxID=370438 RepID=TRPD_PELTS|nr:RecName: Full=Anthranilate phosphoribosyltransferase [Pelotomaculum thermopropionicum SI]NPV74373.1 anthranilate phosphoribosyltransferase [Pelotomaculum sp.]BAF59807.1 anthranilate phosphoribosyltransferase [Pelotomaculum thermopropionicum SI]